MTKKMKRRMIGLGIALAVFLGLGVFVCVWFFGESYPAFDGAARAEAPLPDLSDGFCPQGACALPANAEGYEYAVSGYYKAGVPSRVYLIGENKQGYVTLTKEGSALDTHFGGVTSTENYLIVASDRELVRVPLSAVYAAAANGGAVAVTDVLNTGIPNAYCAVYGNTLYAGEFYRAGNYETDKSHHITVNGETNRAIVYCFEVDENAEGGVASKTPFAALSVRGLVQGIAVTPDYIYLSCSWGLADSELCRYRNILGGDADTALNGVPVYFLGEEEAAGVVYAPSMAEGIFLQGDRLCILFESGTNKYKFFVRRQTWDITSIPLDLFE